MYVNYWRLYRATPARTVRKVSVLLIPNLHVLLAIVTKFSDKLYKVSSKMFNVFTITSSIQTTRRH